jgi:hypothetical protein
MNKTSRVSTNITPALKERFARATRKRLQTQAAVIERFIEGYCEEADRMGTPKNINQNTNGKAN